MGQLQSFCEPLSCLASHRNCWPPAAFAKGTPAANSRTGPRHAAPLGDSQSDRTGHPSSPYAAITIGIFRQILLVIILGHVKRSGLNNLGGACAISCRVETRVERGSARLSRGLLRRGGPVDAAAVLRADVIALAIQLGGIVNEEKNLQFFKILFLWTLSFVRMNDRI